MKYKVVLPMFEGPFDLLVYLIETSKMSIYDIHICSITNEYLEYINQLKEANINVATEFMVLAASLLEIKSKMILPIDNDGDNETTAEDPRTPLVEKIIEYKEAKERAKALHSCFLENVDIYEKPQEDLSQYQRTKTQLASLDVKQFISSFEAFLIKKERLAQVHKNYEYERREKVSLENRISWIYATLQGHFERLGEKEFIPFKRLIQEQTKYDFVTSFVAILQMTRDKLIDVRQDTTYGDIDVILHSNTKGQSDE